jgi:hypothetical protein
MIHNHWLSITHHDSRPAFCWTSGFEWWCVMLSKWLWLMVCNAEQVVVSHGELCWASGCESWCVMLSQWLWIMVCYNYTPSITITCSALHTITQNHWSSKMHHNSQPLSHIIHNQLLGMTHHVILSQWLWVMVCNAKPVVVNYVVLCWVSGC